MVLPVLFNRHEEEVFETRDHLKESVHRADPAKQRRQLGAPDIRQPRRNSQGQQLVQSYQVYPSKLMTLSKICIKVNCIKLGIKILHFAC